MTDLMPVLPDVTISSDGFINNSPEQTTTTTTTTSTSMFSIGALVVASAVLSLTVCAGFGYGVYSRIKELLLIILFFFFFENFFYATNKK